VKTANCANVVIPNPRPLRVTDMLFLFISLFSLSGAAFAQGPATGTPPFGSVSGGLDVVNNSNLNVHLSIPVLHRPGRGTRFTYDLSYDSSIWSRVYIGGTSSWVPNPNFGWDLSTQAFSGYAGYSVNTGTCYSDTGRPENYTFYSDFYYVDAFGINHPFLALSILASIDSFGCSGLDTQGTDIARDGSGLSISSAWHGSTTVTTSTGRVISPPVNVTTGAGSFTDRNGNIISTDGSGHFYDTLSGTTPVLTQAGSGTPASPYTFTYTAPSGANASYTMKYATYSIQSNFGCSGIGEYGTNGTITANLVSEIDLPDWNASTNPNSKYTFTYEATPGHSGFVTGRVASISLPTGGSITYTYTGGSNGITCADGSTAGLTRAVYNGTNTNAWTYSRTAGSGAAYTTKINDPERDTLAPNGNDTVIQFQGPFETQRQIYQGTSTSGTLLKTITICYNGNTTNCSSTAVNLPITQRNITNILPGTNNLQSLNVYKYSPTGSLTEQDDYDYGSGAPGSLLKKTAITYASLGAITSSRQTITVTNSVGTTISKINYNYDETAITATSGTPQHTSVSGSRGNLTSINYYTSATIYLTRSLTYFDTGAIRTTTDVNGAQTTFNYANATSTCGNTFATSASQPLSLSKSMTWNCTGAAQLTVVDENSQTTTTTYNDPYFWRPASVTDPSSAVANMTYTGQTQAESSISFNSLSSNSDVLFTLDGLGRNHVSQIRKSPGGSNFDSTETDYDALGRPSRVTLPYVGIAGATSSTAPAQTFTYDALSRTLSISDSSGGSRTYSYSQNDTYITRGPAPTGENAKRRQEEFNALGRLVSVCEITAGTTSAPAGTCAQNSSQTGYWTKYSYDALGRLTGVTQNAQSSNPQTRTYAYDLLGRLTSETNPENGTTTYVYDTDATCGTSNGDLVRKSDAVGNLTCTAYDSLHRATAITYPSGTYASVTPAKHFVYDSATVNGVVVANVKGRLAEAFTCTGTCTSKITDEGFSYTVRGETSDVYMSTPHSNGYYHVSAQYWANGALKQIASLAGLPTMTFTPDSEGRLYQVSASSGQNPVTNTVFNSASLVTSVTYGSGDSDSFTYDANTNRLTQYQFTVNSQSLTGVLTWNSNHTLASQNITDPFDSADQQNCSYAHDDLTRLASVNCGAVWSQTFSYDAFGNLSKSGTQSFQPTYKDTSGNTTNRYVSIPGTTVSYDANGNVLSDGSHTYSMDSAGRPVSVDSVNLTYDALGRMVEQNRSGSYTQIVYGPKSLKLALMNGQNLQKGLVPLPGGGLAVYNSSGLLYYGHSDHLGSTKLGSTPSRTIYFDLAYAPFGEVYATSGTTDPAFTGQRQDTVSGVFDFPDREYSTQGRWPHPDPSGLASVQLSDPQTLNRYAYVRNGPLALVDPNGLEIGCEEDGICLAVEETGGGGGGSVSVDPTLGGAPQNAGTDIPANTPINQLPTGVELIQPDGTSTTIQDASLYTVTVNASISQDGPPAIETESADLGNLVINPPTQLALDCGSCILSQMQNSTDAMSTLGGASTVVNGLGYVGVAGAGGVGTVVAAPVVVSFVAANGLKIVAITTASAILSEYFSSAFENETVGTIGPPIDPHDPSKEPREPDEREESAPVGGPPTPP